MKIERTRNPRRDAIVAVHPGDGDLDVAATPAREVEALRDVLAHVQDVQL